MSGQPHQRQPKDVVRSSAAEYLTFVAATGDQPDSVEMRYEDENIWLTQKLMASLYGVTVQAIGQHLKRIFADSELDAEAVVKQYLTTAADGSRVDGPHSELELVGGHCRCRPESNMQNMHAAFSLVADSAASCQVEIPWIAT